MQEILNSFVWDEWEEVGSSLAKKKVQSKNLLLLVRTLIGLVPVCVCVCVYVCVCDTHTLCSSVHLS